MHDTHLRFGALWLAEGVWPRHVATCLFGAFLGVSLTTFISAINPYVLTVQLGLPVAEQGRVSGQLIFYSALVLLSLSAVVGVWSDRIGADRKFKVPVRDSLATWREAGDRK